MKTVKLDEAPYDDAMSKADNNEFSRLTEAARSLFFRRLNQFPRLRTDPTFQFAMHIATSEDEAHCFPVAIFFVAQGIDSVSGPGNPNVLDILMDSVSDVFR